MNLAKARTSDESSRDARESLVEGCLATTAFLALNLAPSWMSDLDAIQSANLILSKLIEDPLVSNPVARLTPEILKRYEEIEREHGGRNPWTPPSPEGGSGVREPRRPLPTLGGGSIGKAQEGPNAQTEDTA
jgi:hypothetical protein